MFETERHGNIHMSHTGGLNVKPHRADAGALNVRQHRADTGDLNVKGLKPKICIQPHLDLAQISMSKSNL